MTYIRKEDGTCKCGRSPTGDCIGWHKLTEEQYQKKTEELELRIESERLFLELKLVLDYQFLEVIKRFMFNWLMIQMGAL